MKRSERIYRSLLRIYPRDFRDEHGEEMSLLFRDRATHGTVRLWLQVLGDLMLHAPQEQWSTMKQDLSLRTAWPPARARLRGNGRGDARPRHWRQLGHLQRHRRRPLARRSGLGSGQPRRRLGVIWQQSLLGLVLSGLFRPAGQRDVRLAGGLYVGVPHDGCQRSVGNPCGAARDRQSALRAMRVDPVSALRRT